MGIRYMLHSSTWQDGSKTRSGGRGMWQAPGVSEEGPGGIIIAVFPFRRVELVELSNETVVDFPFYWIQALGGSKMAEEDRKGGVAADI